MYKNNYNQNTSGDIGINAFENMTIEQIVNFALFKTVNLSTEDANRFSMAVEMLENLMMSDQDKEGEYKQKLDEEEERLTKLYKKKNQERITKELASFKIRLLMTKIKKQIPKKAVLEM